MNNNRNIRRSGKKDFQSSYINSPSSGAAWGGITGNILDQTDLINYINSSESDPVFNSWLLSSPNISVFTNDAGYITDNFYIADGTLNANRTVSGNSKNLIFDSLNNFAVNGSGSFDAAFQWGEIKIIDTAFTIKAIATDLIFEIISGSLYVNLGGALLINSSAGTAGQVLTSAGAGVPPTWSNPTGGGGGVSSVSAGTGMDFTTIISTGSVSVDTSKIPYLASGFSSGFLKWNGSSWIFDSDTYITTISGLNISVLTNDAGYITSAALSSYLTSATAASLYVALAGSYSNPVWLTDLAWSKITGTPDAGGSARGLVNTSNQSFAGAKTFLSSPILDSLAANTILATDSSKAIQSLDTSTYPSLTEFSYVKGLTSALQPQIDSKFTTPAGWTDYYASSTIVGWSSSSGVINYILIGKILIIQVYIVGTSNATSISFTIPYTTNATCGNQAVMVHGVNNSTTQSNATLFIPQNSNVVTAYLNNNVTTNAWNSAGTKRIEGFMVLNVQ